VTDVKKQMPIKSFSGHQGKRWSNLLNRIKRMNSRTYLFIIYLGCM
jgi:hypothetical protein